MQGELNYRIEQIDQAASQPIVSPDPTQVVTESPQQPLAPASSFFGEESQQLPDSDPSTQGTGLEEQNPFVDAAPIIEQPLLEFPAITPPLPPTVDQPAQDFSENDAKFTSPSTPEPHLDSTGDDKSYGSDSDSDSESEYTSSSTTSEDDD